MLEHGELKTAVNELGQLTIDISELDHQALIKSVHANSPICDEAQKALIDEIIASVVVSRLEKMISDAFELAKSWKRQASRTLARDA